MKRVLLFLGIIGVFVSIFSFAYSYRTFLKVSVATEFDRVGAMRQFGAIYEGRRQTVESLSRTIDNMAGQPITLGFVGDIMLDRGVQNKIDLRGGDYRFPFEKIKPFLEDFDFLFGNLEGSMSDKGSDRNKLYSFRMDPKSVDGLLYAGFNVLSLANNHALDWGSIALADTARRLRDTNIAPAGASDTDPYRPVFVSVGPYRIGIVASTPFTEGVGAGQYGIAGIDWPKLSLALAEARAGAHIVVASFHFGEEYVKEPSANDREIARNAIALGADIVAGHHPHVVGPIEFWQDGVIAYSLGNFVFDQPFSKATMESTILSVTFDGGKISDAHLIPLKINADFQPFLPLLDGE